MLREYEVVMKAAADPTRARILKMLQDGEMCVCQVIAVLGLSQSTVSKHLSLLKAAGLVRERRDRKFVHYSLDPSPRSQTARSFLAGMRGWMEDDPRVVRDREEASVARRMIESMASVLGPGACSLGKAVPAGPRRSRRKAV